jgi:hypothetical protein
MRSVPLRESSIRDILCGTSRATRRLDDSVPPPPGLVGVAGGNSIGFGNAPINESSVFAFFRTHHAENGRKGIKKRRARSIHIVPVKETVSCQAP